MPSRLWVLACLLLLLSCSRAPAEAGATSDASGTSVPAAAGAAQDAAPAAVNQHGVPAHACCESAKSCCSTPGCCDMTAAAGEGCKSAACPRLKGQE